MTPRLRVPADLRDRIADAAANMGVPPRWVLRACIESALDDEDDHRLVLAVESVASRPRVIRMPKYHRSKT